ncbi:hypothetical protein ELH77_12485 [Rhizobium ruizarguesonis]|uniref:patatin-like phospholipase family protein n=1 Tax=Rhizobium ruizarguesonis TaxID=2081791 RepID=UPI00103025E5|nr:patatin-like phospholipase family protein [Rhizobium ruizarguesonis]TAZ19523.1 hypothetical protein ELH77_12485 [Rhizobium ruizarguesonis]
MPYDIEVISLGADLYPFIERAIRELNGLQDQFRFRLPLQAQRSQGLTFNRTEYLTTDVWSFLKSQSHLGGKRDHIIAIVDAPLRSPRLSNLFGSHDAADGMAVVSVRDSGHYVKEINRFYCYYLVRYAMSFVNPQIRAHNDPALANCYFHQKIDKRDIRKSMDTGFLCDACRAQFKNPIAPARLLAVEEEASIGKMLAYVSGQLPYSLVMKGGGVKGLAFAGVLVELEKHFYFDRHVGASAGAIAALLLSASYTPSELTELLKNKDFRDFKDARWWQIPFNLIFRPGLYPGIAFKQWLSDLLAAKFNIVGEIQMQHLNGATVYASRRGSGTVTFDSNEPRKETIAVHAARCSMSIPLFFVPELLDGRRVFDGGLRNNFPLAKFLSDNGNPTNFIALYLGKRDTDQQPRFLTTDLLDIVIEGEERVSVDKHREKVIVIDTDPIGTIDFNLTAIEKDFLLSLGRAAGMKFLYDRAVDNGPTRAEVDKAAEDAEFKRLTVTEMRASRRRRRNAVIGIVAFIVAVFAYAIKAPS